MQVMHIKRVSEEVWQKDRGLGMPMNENKGILLPRSTQNKEDQIPGVILRMPQIVSPTRTWRVHPQWL